MDKISKGIKREDIVSEIKKISEKLGTTQLTRSEFQLHSNISLWYVYKYFETWNEAVEEAGLVPHREREKIEDDMLFLEMKKVFIDEGEICTRMKFARLSKFSIDVFKKRFGKWKSVLMAFKNWLEERGDEFQFMDKLIKISEGLGRKEIPIAQEQSSEEIIRKWDSISGTKYGSLLNFRGLQHAPLNEQGVVFLFGMICFELGIVVEAIRSEYPDCEAKRRIDKHRDIWEKVKIEFEYQSGNFRDHGHKPEECDLIVCWEHNWEDCPIEVLELKSEIKNLLP